MMSCRNSFGIIICARKGNMMRCKLQQSLILLLLLFVGCCCCWVMMSSSFLLVEGGSSSPLILRLRNPKTGSMERLLVSDPENQSLQDVLGSQLSEDMKCCTNNNNNNNNNDNSGLDVTERISNLNLSNGAMITLSSNKQQQPQKMMKKAKVSESVGGGGGDIILWEPFPELSKRKKAARRRRSHSRVANFGDYSSESNHVVEAQPTGPIQRMYMCQLGASQFQMHVSPNKKGVIKNRVGWLFGTVQEERVHKGKKPAKTSLSTPVYEQDMCTIVKVHATWAPPQQPNDDNSYDATSLLTSSSSDDDDDDDDDDDGSCCLVTQRAIQIAEWLGLEPVGWIFSYHDNRMNEDSNENQNSDEGGALPITGRDVYVGATAQCHFMKRKSSSSKNEEEIVKPRAWITAAMDATTGATEIFQLSDVSVQMTHEGVIPSSCKNQRFITTTKPISIVASPSPESNELDSVLCLVNTALLSQTGLYSGKGGGNVVNKKGFFTNATKKRLSKLLMELQTNNNHGDLFDELCNFQLLVALDRLLSVSNPMTPSKKNEDDSMQTLCGLVRRYARGQKKTTKLPQNLQLLLKHVLQ